jgi:type IV pilus assembly protein PilW
MRRCGVVKGRRGLVSDRGRHGPAQAGLSLLELMVALLLGLLLSAGIVQVYLESKRSYLADEAMARIQEHGRFATTLLKRELAMAGFFGGAWPLDAVPTPAVATDCVAGRWALATEDPVDALNDYPGGAPTLASGRVLTCLEAGAIQPGSDLLALKRTAGEASLDARGYAPGFTPSDVERWYLQLSPAGAGPAWVRRSAADLYATYGPLDPNGPGPAAAYWERYSRIFYLRTYSDPDRRPDNVPVLCEESLGGGGMATRCLVEGIEDLQVEFGIDTDADGVANRYRPAGAGGDPGRAVSARIYLLVRSIEEVPGVLQRTQRSYHLGGKTLTRRDRYLRRVFTTTVQLHNAALPPA